MTAADPDPVTVPAADWWAMRSQATTAEARVALLQTELEAAYERGRRDQLRTDLHAQCGYCTNGEPAFEGENGRWYHRRVDYPEFTVLCGGSGIRVVAHAPLRLFP